jgi:transposase
VTESDAPRSKVEALRQNGSLNLRPETVADKAFHTNPFFDPYDLVQVKYEMLRRVHLEGQPVAETAASFGFSRPSFYRVQAGFQADGLPGLLPRQRGPQRPHKVTEPIQGFLRQALADNPALSAKQLAHMVEERFGVSVHPRTIERSLATKKNR